MLNKTTQLTCMCIAVFQMVYGALLHTPLWELTPLQTAPAVDWGCGQTPPRELTAIPLKRLADQGQLNVH